MAKFHYIANAFGVGQTWAETELNGEWDLIAPTSTEGALYVIGADDTTTDCTDGWGLRPGCGIETGRTGTTISATPEFLSGVWRVILCADGYGTGPTPPDNLCRFVTVTASTGTFGVTGWFVPGAAYPDGESIGLYGPQCIWWIDIAFTDATGTITFTISDDDECGDCVEIENNRVSRYSTDFGETFATAETIGLPVDGGAGVDTVKIGSVILAGAAGQVMKATSGGAWSAYGDPLPAGLNPTCIVIPRRKDNGSSNTTSTPDYFVASNVLDGSGASLYYVSSAGTVFDDRTITVSGDKGLCIGQHSLAASWWSTHVAAVLDFGGTPRLITSSDFFTTTNDKGVLDDDACSVEFRKGNNADTQLYISNGSPAYSPNKGATISKGFPADSATEPIIGVKPIG